MKKSPYLKNLNRIEFIVTYQCTGRCIHCSLGEQLNRPEKEKCVRPEPAAQAVSWLARHFAIRSVMTFGGEPLLYPDTVCAIHRAAAENGVPTRQLITNGCFSRRQETIDETAVRLHDAGVNDLLLSVDAFHQQHIPIDLVYRFARALCQVNLKKFRLQPCWLVNQEHENPYNQKTREILRAFEGLDIPVNQGNEVFMAGNAKKYLSQYYPAPRLDLSDRCGSMPYTEPPDDVRSLSILPGGDVTVCDFVIGNIYREGMEEIVARYNPYENDCMRALIEGGAGGLLAWAKGNGIDVDASGCYSVCDVCHCVLAAQAD